MQRSVRMVVVALMMVAAPLVWPPPAAAAAAWQITVTRIDPSPQPSGGTMLFRVQLQCAAVDEEECLDSTVSWPADAPSTFTVGNHPAIESWAYDDVNDEWVVDLQDVVLAGVTFEFDVIATVPNNTTPDGTTVTIEATIDAANTASATNSASGEWTATGDLTVEKYGQFGPDADLILDQPVKYYLYPCDPSWESSKLGHLFVVDFTMVDTLPPGSVFVEASLGGIYDGGAHAVTWSDPGPVGNRSCTFGALSPYWVEVIFPSTVFGPSAVPPVLVATNTVTVEGYPVGAVQDATTFLTDTDVISHGFGLPNPCCGHTKRSITPYFNNVDITYAGDRASFYSVIRTSNLNSANYYWQIVDPLPCLTSDDVDGDLTTTPNQYSSLLPTDPACVAPAFQPTDRIHLDIDPRSHVQFGSQSAAEIQAWIDVNPTVPLRYVTTTGREGVVDMPHNGSTWPDYTMLWPDFVAAAGLAAGEQIATFVWDSRDIGLQVRTSVGSNDAATLALLGTVADDSATYPMADQTRVRNRSYFNAFLTADAPDSAAISMGSIQADVIVVARGTALEVFKSRQNGASGPSMSIEARIAGGDAFRPDEDLIVADLLPPGYQFDSLQGLGYALFDDDPEDTQSNRWEVYRFNRGDPFTFRNSTNNTYLDTLDPRSYVEIEIIDDYNGTGRQLVRASFSEPPVVEGWQSPRNGVSSFTSASMMAAISLRFYVTPLDLSYSAVNVANVYPSDPASAATLQCLESGTLVGASTDDGNDLDGDGIVSGDAYCGDDLPIVPATTAVVVDSFNAVKGDLDITFEPFPAIGAITTSGGTAQFSLDLANLGNVSVENLVIYDVLPHVNDTGLSETQAGVARQSDWAATFVGFDATTVPAGVEIMYSASTNPCRDELTTGATPFPAGCVDDWSTSLPPGGAGDVAAFRLSFVDDSGGLLTFDPGEQMNIVFDVTYPPGVAPGETAWNNFAFAGTRSDTGAALLPSEPPKVGLALPEVDLEVTKAASSAAEIVGDPTTYTIAIDHAGSVSPTGAYVLPAGTARDVELVDDAVTNGLVVVPGSVRIVEVNTGVANGAAFDPATGVISIPTIGPNDTYELVYQAYSPAEAVVTNTVEVTSHPGTSDVDSVPGNSDPAEDDIASTTVEWLTGAVELRKLVESGPGTGVYIEADASDGRTGIYEPGQPVNYRFVVTNIGSADLQNLVLSDDLVGFECDRNVGFLAAGASTVIDCSWPYGFASGNNVNTAEVDGVTVVGGVPVSSIDTAEVVIVTPADPAILVKKYAQQAPAVAYNPADPTTLGRDAQTADPGVAVVVPEGADVVHRISVLNSGGFPLGSIVVVDTIAACGSPVRIHDGDGDPLDILAVGEIWVYECTIAAPADDYVNIASAAGEPRSLAEPTQPSGDPAVSDADPSAVDVVPIPPVLIYDLALAKELVDPSSAAGSGDRLRYRITVTNQGNVASGEFTVTDRLPPGTTVMAASPNPSSISDSEVVWTVAAADELVPGESATFDLELEVDFPADATIELGVDGEIVNRADVLSTSETDVDPANNSDEVAVSALAAIGDYVWIDDNRDGLQDTGEVPVAGVGVALLDGAGTVVGRTATDADGLYLFTRLAPGDYQLRFDLATIPDGYQPVAPDQVGSDSFDSDSFDSDADVQSGLTSLTNLVAGEVDRTWDLGIWVEATDLAIDKQFVGAESSETEGHWVIRVTNLGPADHAGPISITDSMPIGLRYKSHSGDGWVCVATDSQTVGCDWTGPLANGETTADLRLITHIDVAPGTAIGNSVQIEPTVLDLNITNNEVYTVLVWTEIVIISGSSSAPPLAFTGASLMVLLMLAGASSSTGVSFVAVSRRSRRRRDTMLD